MTSEAPAQSMESSTGLEGASEMRMSADGWWKEVVSESPSLVAGVQSEPVGSRLEC